MSFNNLAARSVNADEFDSVITYLNALSQRLSRTEFLDIADTLHELVRRRRGEPRSPQKFPANRGV